MFARVKVPINFKLKSQRNQGIFAPKPQYLREWAEQGITGKGVILLSVDSNTGEVTDARVLQSTGHKVLDDSALDAFRKWRFKPGGFTEIKVPIEFTTRGSNQPKS